MVSWNDILLHSNFNSFTYTLTATPRILPQIVERLDDEAESGAAVAENVLRDVFNAGASDPDSRTTSAHFGELPISRLRGRGLLDHKTATKGGRSHVQMRSMIWRVMMS